MADAQDSIVRIPDSVEVPRIGTLQYELGFPTPETTRKLFDEMDFQRAVQAYLWGYPAVSFHPAHGQAADLFGSSSTPREYMNTPAVARAVRMNARATTSHLPFVTIPPMSSLAQGFGRWSAKL